MATLAKTFRLMVSADSRTGARTQAGFDGRATGALAFGQRTLGTGELRRQSRPARLRGPWSDAGRRPASGEFPLKHTSVVFLFFLMLASQPASAQYGPRVFDVVAPVGHEVQQQDGAAVLRLRGQRYGSVLTFVPESAENGWVTLAVVNTGGEAFDAKTANISASYGRTDLTVHKTSALMREQHKRRREMLAYSQFAQGKSLKDLVASNRPITEAKERRGRDGVMTRPANDGDGMFVSGNADAREAKALADAQLIALRERLFPDATVAPGKFSRGDIRVDLPPRREDLPAEFVLRLDFAGEVMDVTFRERAGASVDVGEIEPTESFD